MIISSSKLITIQGAPPISRGAVVIRHGTILVAGPVEKIIKKYPGHEVTHLNNAVLMPGLVNLHTHLELPHFLDAIHADTFPVWVLNLIKKKKEQVAGDYILATEQNIKTLVRTGTTTVGDICTHEVSPALLKQSGLRAVIFNEIISMNPEVPFPRFSSLVSRPSSLMHHGISPHTPYTVSESMIRKLATLSRQKNLRLSMHVAESKDEIKLLQRKQTGLEKLYRFANWDLAWAPTGSSSFDYLQRIGFLSRRLLAVHAVQVSNKDLRLIKKSGVSIAHCPRSNKETGVGKMPLKKFLNAGITVGLGTDSLASSPSLSMWDEMRYAYRIHRRDGITAEDIFRLATIGGATALGLDKEIGTIEPGKKADIIAVPLPTKNTGYLLSDLLRETKSCIMTVVNGKVLYDKVQKAEIASPY